MDLVELFGKNVRRYRQLRGMTQEELAHSADMKRTYVSDMERGKRNPSVKALGRIALALAVEPFRLLTDDPLD